MKSYRIRVIGRVQGVFFRASAKQKADSLGLSGWVRNETDGSVMIEAEGLEKDLENLCLWCKIGPSVSHVENIQIEEIPLKGFKGFKITF